MLTRLRSLPYLAQVAIQAAFLFVTWLLLSRFLTHNSWAEAAIGGVFYAVGIVGALQVLAWRARRRHR